MRIDWDVPILMADGTVLRADVYRPRRWGAIPVILTYGPYAKGLSFQEGYPDQWKAMVTDHPEVTAGSTGKYQSWEVVDPEKWVPDGYACVRVDSRGAGRSPGLPGPRVARRRTATTTSASSGPAPRTGATARSASTASPTTR